MVMAMNAVAWLHHTQRNTERLRAGRQWVHETLDV
jgi:hypothetical protein